MVPVGSLRPQEPSRYPPRVPIFEFRCEACGHKFATLVGVVAGESSQACPKCGSENAQKLVSRFTRARSEDDRLDELADQVESMGEPESPTQMRTLMREMGKALDEDAGDEMEELFEMGDDGEA